MPIAKHSSYFRPAYRLAANPINFWKYFHLNTLINLLTGDFVRIALCFGVTVATMAQSIGHISGCHINPAVTAGLLVGRKIGLIKAILYIVSQCVGAVIGTGLLSVSLMPCIL